MSTYKGVFEKNQYNLKAAVNKSSTWFRQQARILDNQNIDAMGIIRSSSNKNVTRIVPGEMYLFKYFPKLEEKLDYWDAYPLVFPFRKLNDGFIGLNMHYLAYPLRIALLDRLMEYKTNSLLNENTKIKYSWATIQGASKLSMAESCVHRYLNFQLASPIKRIDAVDWATALMLPLESFNGASKMEVWSNSVK